MKKLFFLLPVLLLADVDPFKAGDLNAPNPYGLTPQEKAILQNKKNIKKNSSLIVEIKKNLDKFKSKLSQKFIEYDQTISDLNNKLSSFNTILSEIDSTKASIDKLKKQLKDANLTDVKNRIKILEDKVESLEEQNKAIKKTIKEIMKIQNDNFQNLRNSIQEILSQLKNLNKTEKINPKTAFKKAREYYFDGKLNKAKELFAYSLQKRYLPATSSYYLGEIAYRQRKYKEALAFYKKSITLYPKKTSFTERLLYHTGISFLKLNQKQKAKLTFKKLISDFPNSKYSTLAKKMVREGDKR